MDITVIAILKNWNTPQPGSVKPDFFGFFTEFLGISLKRGRTKTATIPRYFWFFGFAIVTENSRGRVWSIDLEVTTDLCGGVRNPNSRVSGLWPDKCRSSRWPAGGFWPRFPPTQPASASDTYVNKISESLKYRRKNGLNRFFFRTVFYGSKKVKFSQWKKMR